LGQLGATAAGGLALALGDTPFGAAGLLAVAGGWSLVGLAAAEPRRRTMVTTALRWAWLSALPVSLVWLRGTDLLRSLPVVSPLLWGGLLLTLVLAAGALAAAFPVGVVLALCRASSLPLVRGLSTAFIETVRGVPLVTVLFMSQVMLPLFIPPGPWLARVLRAMVGFAVFSAAYIAEDVRGGLAAVSPGQYDAARALGLSTPKLYRLVVLPQAIRVVVPALAGQFISLFKDTSLVAIVNLNDLLGIARDAVAQPEWQGRWREALLFVGAVYFVFCHAMATVSRRLETPAAQATRRGSAHTGGLQ
jgi:general L-amino acid transport system permease protein